MDLLHYNGVNIGVILGLKMSFHAVELPNVIRLKVNPGPYFGGLGGLSKYTWGYIGIMENEMETTI